MTKPKPFVVQPEWRDGWLCMGPLALGMTGKHPWGGWSAIYWHRMEIPPSQHTTEAEARAAVENAVREALGGKDA
jgi:hypothetical protein